MGKYYITVVIKYDSVSIDKNFNLLITWSDIWESRFYVQSGVTRSAI